MLVSHSHPIFPADFPSTRVEKVGHHSTFGERLFVLLKTLVQIGLMFGVGKFLSCFDFLANRSIGFFLELVAAVQQVLERMELVTHPEAILASGLVAGFEANTPIGGHAHTVEAMSPEVVKMRFPRLGRAI